MLSAVEVDARLPGQTAGLLRGMVILTVLIMMGWLCATHTPTCS